MLRQQDRPIAESEVAKQLGLQPYFLARWLKMLAADQPLPELEQFITASKSSPVPEVGLPEPSGDLIMQAKQLERALNKALQSKDSSSEEKNLLKTYVLNDQADLQSGGQRPKRPARRNGSQISGETAGGSRSLEKGDPPCPQKWSA